MLAAAALLVLVSMLVRLAALPAANIDTVGYITWYGTLLERGIPRTLATHFTTYSPPYTYLLALATLTRGFLPALSAIKLLPTLFSAASALLVYRLVRVRYARGSLPHLAAALYFAAPTVILNTSFWGQADAIYTFFLLLCLYFLVRERNLAALTSLGVALAFKAQAAFLLPLILILVLRRQIGWPSLSALPAPYLLAIAPTVLLGRPLLDALLVYVKQAGVYSDLSLNAGNPYLFIPTAWESFVVPAGLVLAALALTYWSRRTARSPFPLDARGLVFCALLSVLLAPYLLPKMHERYFFAADVFAILFAFFWPRLWFAPILMQVGSTLSYLPFLFGWDPAIVGLSFLSNTGLIAILLQAQEALAARAPAT